MFTERLKVIIDVVSDKATAGLHGFRTSVAEADGFTGKLKAGVTSLGSTFKSFITSPQGAAVAIAAAGAAMTVAVSQAMDLSLAVGKLKDQTGLSAEAASRWIEVADEMGISADTVASLLTKLEQNLGKSPEAFKELGVQVKYAADGSTDANGTLLAVIDTLNKIKDPAERAAAAQKLLGKGWKEAAEFIAAGSDQVKKKLAEVAGSKLVDDKEIEQARKFRETIDELKDVGEELVITLGQALIPVLNKVVPVLTDVAEGVADVVGVITDMADAVTAVTDALDFMPDVLDVEALEKYAEGTKEAETATLDMGDAGKEAAQAAYELGVAEEAAALQAANLARDIDAAHNAFTQWSDELDDDKSLIDLEIELRGAQEALEGLDPLEKESALLGFKQHIRDVAEGLDGIPEKVITDVVQSFDGANYESIIARLQTLQAIAAAGIHINVSTGMIVGTADSMERRLEAPKVKGKKAAGGPVTSGGAYLVGELGPEIVNIPGGSNVTPNSALGGGVTNVSIAVNVGPGADPVSVGRATADALAAYYRNGGTRP